VPDQTILPTLKSLQAKEDPALEAADAELVRMTAGTRRASNRL
jgi:hypothetical protein